MPAASRGLVNDPGFQGPDRPKCLPPRSYVRSSRTCCTAALACPMPCRKQRVMPRGRRSHRRTGRPSLARPAPVAAAAAPRAARHAGSPRAEANCTSGVVCLPFCSIAFASRSDPRVALASASPPRKPTTETHNGLGQPIFENKFYKEWGGLVHLPFIRKERNRRRESDGGGRGLSVRLSLIEFVSPIFGLNATVCTQK